MSSRPDAFSARREGNRASALGCDLSEAQRRDAAEEAVAAFQPARVFSRLPADRLARKANATVQSAQALTAMFFQESQEESQAPSQEEKSAQTWSQEEKSAQTPPSKEQPQENGSSHQEKGKDQAALYSGSPTCSVGTGVVTPA
jgi:hypothetical protein